MASKARKSFDKNAEDIDRLLDLHASEGGGSVGRRIGLEVLNKSAIVLLCAFWEAYCEDIAAEALDLIVSRAPTAAALSKQLRQRIAKDLKLATHDLAVWDLADDGWRKVLASKLAALQEDRNRRLNTPKAEHIDTLFLEAIGLEKVSSAWKWEAMSVTAARDKLDRFVELRGAIAHRGSVGEHCRRHQVTSYFSHIKRLVAKTGGRVNRFVKEVAGVPLW